MIYYFTIDQLSASAQRELVIGGVEVYDVTYRDLSRESKTYLYQYKWLGHSVVFRYGGRNKILIFGRK
jgi:hypothetical protein